MEDTLRERKRRNKREWRERNPGLLYHDERPFVGVDGEGGTTVGGSHDYFLLRAGEASISNTQGPLSSWDCLSFLASLDSRPLYVAYFFDYDTTKICQDLGWSKIWRLIHREERMPKEHPSSRPFPVDVHGGEFQIDYLPRKFFKVRQRLPPGGYNPPGAYRPWVEINDVGSFFQCAFTKALERWDIGTPEQRAAIKAGKDYRRAFDARDLPDIDRYNHLECRLLVELMTKFRDTCKRSGYVPRKWQGPGQIAESMMRARGIPKSKAVPLLKDRRYHGLLNFAQRSYYGGRPELTVLGPWYAPAYQYDINSAYPWAMLHLPCLEHGEWEYETGNPVPRRKWSPGLSLVFGHFRRKGDTRARLFGYPVRRENGSIYYPAEGNGWYWNMEANAASHQVLDVSEAWIYRSRCQCQPFGFIHGLYEMRLRLGKDALGLFLKLALNSLYGKMCQSIGSPQYANPIWASFITSFTRTQVQNLIHSAPAHRRGECGRDVLMVATDAIFTTAPLPLEPSKALGGVSLQEHPGGLLLVQPGLYFTGDGSHPKTRGVPQSAVEEREPEFLAAWKRMCETGDENAGTVDIPVKVFVGLRQALHRHKIELAGTWIEYQEDGSEYGKRIGFEWKNKRGALKPPMFGGPAETYPFAGSPETITVPYSKQIGDWRNAMRLPFYDQPDWAQILGLPEED